MLAVVAQYRRSPVDQVGLGETGAAVDTGLAASAVDQVIELGTATFARAGAVVADGAAAVADGVAEDALGLGNQAASFGGRELVGGAGGIDARGEEGLVGVNVPD